MAWKLKFIAGNGEILHRPLSNGISSIDRDVPIIVEDVRDYRRLIRSGKYIEIVEPTPIVDKAPKTVEKPKPIKPEIEAVDAPGAKDNQE